MKEKIEKKLEENIERILNKTEITKEDVEVLNGMLLKIEQKAKDEMYKESNKELAETFSKLLLK